VCYNSTGHVYWDSVSQDDQIDISRGGVLHALSEKFEGTLCGESHTIRPWGHLYIASESGFVRGDETVEATELGYVQNTYISL
jgi:hypothetical protein